MKLNIDHWTKNEYDELINYLKEISDEKYKEFSKNLAPGVNNMLGVQIPKLRIIAKEITRGNYTEFLNLTQNNYHEETMIHGLVIGYIKEDYKNTIEHIKKFLPHITNWAICDSFCTKFNSVMKNRKEFLKFLKECINTNKEFYIRFAVVMLKNIYVDKEYIDIVLKILNDISHEGYYVKMAVAWTLCDSFIKFQDKTMNYLKLNNLDNFTYNKAIQKIIESNRVNEKTKNLVRNMKIK